MSAALADEVVASPNGRLVASVDVVDGKAVYSISYDGEKVLSPSALGLVTDFADWTTNLTLVSATRTSFSDEYSVPTIKKSHVTVNANRMTVNLASGDDKFSVEFHVSDNDVAFRYFIPRQDHRDRGCVRVMKEDTGFMFAGETTAFASQMSTAMKGHKRTTPSYEEGYTPDMKLPAKSFSKQGWILPALFRQGTRWVLLGETGTDSNYAGCHLTDFDGNTTRIAFPQPEENNGNGTVEPAFALPGTTPWRTITVGDSLAPIVETTIAWDVVEAKYPAKDYKYGRGVWSWILGMDESIKWDPLMKYLDLAEAMKFEYILLDNFWDKPDQVGRENIPAFIAEAKKRNVEVFLWYSSSGWWNDIEQSPTNVMSDPIARKREMKWMAENGVKGIKVDFWGGDKQETFRLYEQVLSDADDYGLMVIFHGCTMPRGWERMYPNYVGSEAVVASEMRYFVPDVNDHFGEAASMHPFVRNTLGSMEYGGTFLVDHISLDGKSRHARNTSIPFELATAILFQNPIQNFALAPVNLTDAPKDALDFMRKVPTTWDETKHIAGYPGKYAALARRKGNAWWIGVVTAEPTDLTLDLTPFGGKIEKLSLGKNDGWVKVL